MNDAQLRGVFAAVLTPFDAQYRPDAARAIPYYGKLLEEGCDGLNVLGTTGEAMSVGLQDRLRFMERIANGGLDRRRLMVGTGASSLGDSIALTRAAFDLGFAAALVIPPFYYRDASDEGVARYFEALFAGVQPPLRGIVLYNFPAMSGITFHPDLVERLVREHPDIIAGMKDSSNTFDLEREVFTRDPQLAVFPGSEELLARARDAGLAGCISGSVCLWPALAATVWRSRDEDGIAELVERRKSLRRPLIAAVREAVAAEQRDETWLRSVPPLH